MVHDPADLEQLAQAVRALSPEDRAKVMQAVEGGERPAIRSKSWRVPVLKGGTAWTGGSLRREDMYGDDGR